MSGDAVSSPIPWPILQELGPCRRTVLSGPHLSEPTPPETPRPATLLGLVATKPSARSIRRRLHLVIGRPGRRSSHWLAHRRCAHGWLGANRAVLALFARRHGSQKPQFGLHFRGIGHSIRDLLAQEFAIPLAKSVNRHFERSVAAYGASDWPERKTFNRSKCSGRPCCTNSFRYLSTTRSSTESARRRSKIRSGVSSCAGSRR
jgi:hypothetical protein